MRGHITKARKLESAKGLSKSLHCICLSSLSVLAIMLCIGGKSYAASAESQGNSDLPISRSQQNINWGQVFGSGPKLGDHYLIRSNENWCKRSPPVSNVLDRMVASLKCIPLDNNQSVYVTFSGEERLEDSYQEYSNILSRGLRDQHILDLRSQYGADLHITPYFRAFFEIANAQQWGVRLSPSQPKFRNEAILDEAFGELRLPINSEKVVGVRFGRQKIQFGDGYLLGLQEHANIETTYNGIDSYYSGRNSRIDVFDMEVTSPQYGLFGDYADQKQRVWGIYTSIALPRTRDVKLNLSPFYIGLRQAGVNYDGVSGVDTRQTLGMRLWGNAGPFVFDWTAAHQIGSLGHDSVSAWAVFSSTGIVDRSLRIKPEIGLTYNLMSGGKSGSEVHTWNPIYMDYGKLTPRALFGGSNLVEIGPFLTFEPNHNLRIRLAYDFFYRYSTDDAIYTAGFRALPGTTGYPKEGKFLASQPVIEMRYKLNRYMDLHGAVAYIKPGGVAKFLGGRNQIYTDIAAYLFF